jgi:polar amino acid transport system substrate-binding protein
MTNMHRIFSAAVALTLVLAGCASAPATTDPQETRALAPTGSLRIGLYPGTPTSIITGAAPGEAKGVAHDVARHFAGRLGIAFEPVVFPRNADVLAAGKSGRVDLVFTNATPARAKDMDFSPTVLEIELGYLVSRGSRLSGIADVDRAGVRVGVSQGSTSQSVLSRDLRNAVVVATPSLKEAAAMLSGGKLDAFATNKATLFQMSDGLPGSRVLDGRWGVERFAFGIPKGRESALPLLSRLVEEAKVQGVVTRAADRAGLRGRPSEPN